MAETKEDCKDETKLQSGFIKGFSETATSEFKDSRERLEAEMGSRFSHQDEVIDDLQKFIKSFQGILKVFGGNV